MGNPLPLTLNPPNPPKNKTSPLFYIGAIFSGFDIGGGFSIRGRGLFSGNPNHSS